jgi:hypothetical protein
MKFQPLTFLACLSLPLAGCILVPDSDDDATDDDVAYDTDDYEDSETSPPQDDGADDAADTDGSDDGADDDADTDGEPEDDELECGDNLVADPGFETGTPNEMWEEASALFGTPLCDASCTTDEGAEPYAGDWWIWFGGMDEAEQASMAQTVTFDAEHALLAFQFSINAAAGTGDDMFMVRIDEDTVFMATDAEWATYDGYTPVEIDVSAYADGAEHTITFAAETMGGGLTNFFVDDVSLTECTDPADVPDTDTDTDTDSAGESGESGDTDSDTDGAEETGAEETGAEESGGETGE